MNVYMYMYMRCHSTKYKRRMLFFTFLWVFIVIMYLNQCFPQRLVPWYFSTLYLEVYAEKQLMQSSTLNIYLGGITDLNNTVINTLIIIKQRWIKALRIMLGRIQT